MFRIASIAFIIFLKFAIPVAIVFSPFIAGWANFVLDTIDGDMLIPLGLADSTYQPIDKIADWATYIGMVFAAWRLKWGIRKWIYGLFAFRSIGQLAFLLTGDERLLFFFPNFLEPLFLVYATIFFFKKASEFLTFEFYLKHKWAIWIFVVLYKMQDEYLTHIANIDRSDAIKGLINKLF
ncbi:MAG: hypothetical protein WCX23_00430 [Candidatus Paceibacterota bacterium]|jgi:hypothetical protein|nr:hypothetical protein [Candidatus Paceibacterota bacterium]